MIYITGDTHGRNSITKLNVDNFPEQQEMTKEDVIIICGDFGVIWKDDSEMKYWLNWLDKKNFTTLFVDGNHENFNLLYQYPVVDKYDGKVGKINDSVFHLKRGQVYDIQGKTFLTFGGARSHDKAFRTEFVSWWKEEEPTYEEATRAIKAIEECPKNIDFVITHSSPYTVSNELVRYAYDDPTEVQLNVIMNKLEEYKHNYHWYYGHYHLDRDIGRFHGMYHRILKIL